MSSPLRLVIERWGAPAPRKIEAAVEVLHRGGVAAYPTDSIYALGCAIEARDAIEKIYRAKHMKPGQRLALIATGPRARLDLWRAAAGEDGGLYGVAFAAVRESAGAPIFDFYTAVHPSMRRQGLARALSEAALQSGATLRARVREDATPGRAFLRALGFVEVGAQPRSSTRAPPSKMSCLRSISSSL